MAKLLASADECEADRFPFRRFRVCPGGGGAIEVPYGLWGLMGLVSAFHQGFGALILFDPSSSSFLNFGP